MTEKKEIERASLLLTCLEKPYYLNTNPLYKVFISFFMGFIVYLFLVLIRPLPIKQITSNLDLFALNTGILISSIFFTFHFIIKKIFTRFFNPNNWNIGKHLVSFFGIILVASFINWNTNKYLKKENNIKFESYLQFFSLAISVGLLPMSFYLIIDERYGRSKRNKNVKIIKKATFIEKNKKNVDAKVTLYSYNSKDFIKFNTNRLVYITSEANYASFFVLENNNLKEYLLRNTLRKIEKALVDYDTIFRCHKSYIINKDFITEISGNAHGFRLNLKYCDNEIPVSRKFTREDIEELIQ